jgi:O-antigen/teichoic acid export membrane protein
MREIRWGAAHDCTGQSRHCALAGISRHFHFIAAIKVIKGVSHSLLDQVLLSVSNFLIGLVFIKFATKQDYYAYSQLVGYIALTSALQGALVNTTALTILPPMGGALRERTANVFFSAQTLLSLMAAVLGGLVIWLWPTLVSMDSVPAWLALAMTTMVAASWMREFLRNFLFINQSAPDCLKMDLTYVLFLGGMIALIISSNRVQTSTMMLAMGLAGLLVAMPWLWRAALHWNFKPADWRALWVQVQPLAVWSVPAGVVAWAFGNGYLLIGAKSIGPEAMAEIVAAKLFTAPLGTLFVSWANIFRPKVSRSIAHGQRAEVLRLTRISVVGVFAIVAIYGLALNLAYPHLEAYVLGQKYQGLQGDIFWWSVFFLASGISGVCNGVLLAGGRFRPSFYAAFIAAWPSLLSMMLLVQWFGKAGLMGGLVFGEACYAAVLYVAMRRLLAGVPETSPTGG